MFNKYKSKKERKKKRKHPLWRRFFSLLPDQRVIDNKEEEGTIKKVGPWSIAPLIGYVSLTSRIIRNFKAVTNSAPSDYQVFMASLRSTPSSSSSSPISHRSGMWKVQVPRESPISRSLIRAFIRKKLNAFNPDRPSEE